MSTGIVVDLTLRKEVSGEDVPFDWRNPRYTSARDRYDAARRQHPDRQGTAFWCAVGPLILRLEELEERLRQMDGSLTYHE